MVKTITAEFNDRSAAQWAIYELYRGGVPRHMIKVEPIGGAESGRLRVTAWGMDNRTAKKAMQILKGRGAEKLKEIKGNLSA
jgi:hypothetical protein